MKYVLGFLFNENKTKVALIRKTKPIWQRGKLNGIGGKIEDHDISPLEAMKREFLEEAGLEVSNWKSLCEYKVGDNTIYCYTSIGDLTKVKTKTEEPIRVIEIGKIPRLKTIQNLKWLIPMALYSKNIVKIEEI